MFELQMHTIKLLFDLQRDEVEVFSARQALDYEFKDAKHDTAENRIMIYRLIFDLLS